MSWKICPACNGACYLICKDKCGNEIPHKCPVCDGRGEIFVEQTHGWRPNERLEIMYDIYCHGTDNIEWVPADDIFMQY